MGDVLCIRVQATCWAASEKHGVIDAIAKTTPRKVKNKIKGERQSETSQSAMVQISSFGRDDCAATKKLLDVFTLGALRHTARHVARTYEVELSK